MKALAVLCAGITLSLVSFAIAGEGVSTMSTLPNLPEVFGTGRASDATYWGLLRKEMRKKGKWPKEKKAK